MLDVTASPDVCTATTPLAIGVTLHVHPRVAELTADVPLLSMSLVDRASIHNHDIVVHAHDDILVLHALVLECARPNVSDHLRLRVDLAQVVDHEIVISALCSSHGTRPTTARMTETMTAIAAIEISAPWVLVMARGL
jgi:hypothetical protein